MKKQTKVGPGCRVMMMILFQKIFAKNSKFCSLPCKNSDFSAHSIKIASRNYFYYAGDCDEGMKYRQAIIAAGDGAYAALSLIEEFNMKGM